MLGSLNSVKACLGLISGGPLSGYEGRVGSRDSEAEPRVRFSFGFRVEDGDELESKLLKGGYTGDYIREYYRSYQGDTHTRSLDYSSDSITYDTGVFSLRCALRQARCHFWIV